MSELITDAMAETAAKARWDYKRVESGDTTEWEMRHPAFRAFDFDSMRAALEAVAPTLTAKALRDFDDRVRLPRQWHERVLEDALRIERGEL